MTPQDIIARLFGPKGITADRVRKARALAQRMKVSWDSVLAAMTPDQRQQVQDA